MDPPIGHGFRDKKRTQLLQLSKVSMKTTIKPLKKRCKTREAFNISDSEVKKYVKSNSNLSSANLNKSGNNNFSNATLITTNTTTIITTTTAGNSNQTIQNLDLWNRCKYIQPLYYISNMKSLIISLITVLILNNFGCFISTNPSVAAYTQRENTRILPLQTDGLI
uniref:Uncharacterized protein n=1 Tax=Glossina brevipalpis TaxID=37001 RepID=A0A1A9WCK7_9MUSC